jgi:uncharacterized protein YqjF (DUF2071 family)
MLNYEIAAPILFPFVPRGTELDDFEGRHFCSIVGFLFRRTRIRGVAVPFHVDFEEVNLRFYVRRRVAGEWRRAAVFISELVPRFWIAAIARVVYNERYRAVPMRHHVQLPVDGSAGRVDFGFRVDGRWGAVSATTVGAPAVPGEASLERFITEHYWGYAAQRDRGTVEYQVAHPPWRVWQVSRAALDAPIGALYGAQFVEALSVPPASAFVAEGSDVAVYPGVRVTG